MKIDPNCIRDLPWAVENACDYEDYFEYDKSNKPSELLNYTHRSIIYHASQCADAGLFKNFLVNDEATNFLVSDLTPLGHQFLAKIRDDAAWKKIAKYTFLTLIELIKFVLPFLPMIPH